LIIPVLNKIFENETTAGLIPALDKKVKSLLMKALSK
jgi:hypothetical protein